MGLLYSRPIESATENTTPKREYDNKTPATKQVKVPWKTFGPNNNIFKSVSLEIICGILDNFTRRELFDLQFLCRQFDTIVKTHYNQKPLYIIRNLNFEECPYTYPWICDCNYDRLPTPSFPTDLLTPSFIRIEILQVHIRNDTFTQSPSLLTTLCNYSHVLLDLDLIFDSNEFREKSELLKDFESQWRTIFNLPCNSLLIMDSSLDGTLAFSLPGIEQRSDVKIKCNKLEAQGQSAVQWLFAPNGGQRKRLCYVYHVTKLTHPNLAEGLAAFIETLKERFMSLPSDVAIAEFDVEIREVGPINEPPTLEDFYLLRSVEGGKRRLALSCQSNELIITCRYHS